MEFFCYFENCNEEFMILKDVIDHLKTKHMQKENMTIKCVILHKNRMTCESTFQTYRALKAHVTNKKCKILSKKDEAVDPYKNVNSFFDHFKTTFNNFNVDHNTSTEIIKLFIELLTEIHKLTLFELQRYNNIDSGIILNNVNQFVLSKFKSFSTRYRRDKEITSKKLYVAPETIEFDTKKDSIQYIPIIKTLESVFSDEDFKNIYFAYNDTNTCVEGEYSEYCCGENYKNSELFQREKNALQLQLFVDEFELCAPLKTRTRKVCGFYMIIRNTPAQFRSKLKNMYLVILCETRVLNKYGYNTVMSNLAADLKRIEENGISIQMNQTLKGTLVQVCFDNLGGNHLFGFSRSFNAHFYCRICFLSKKDCQIKTTEVCTKVRTKENYDAIIEQLETYNHHKNKQIDPKVFLGYKNRCILNELKYYDITSNRSQDIMHDILEGAVPLVLKHFFWYLQRNKIEHHNEIQRKAKSFNYGVLNLKNKPSDIKFDKTNLNQNATQSYCLILHLPFILQETLEAHHNTLEKKRKLDIAWMCIEYLLKIMQIVFSESIQETNVNDLKEYIDIFLNSVKEVFEVNLTPKLHFLTHYPNTIKTMGPLKFIEMRRGEAKHRQFTNYVNQSKNFKNVTKMLAFMHQRSFPVTNAYKDGVEISKKTWNVMEFAEKNPTIKNYITLLQRHFGNLNNFIVPYKVTLNSRIYKEGFLLNANNKFYKIVLLLLQEKQVYFCCQPYEVLKYSSFSNSYMINKSLNANPVIINLKNLKNNRCYEEQILYGQSHIILDTLDIKIHLKQ